jgi:hypothetical protein
VAARKREDGELVFSGDREKVLEVMVMEMEGGNGSYNKL